MISMKKNSGIIRILAILLAIPSAGFGQVVENPAKPRAASAGRVLKLAEVWRITDESGAFYFKHPSQLQIAADGSIFVANVEQLLRFSLEGRFLKNLYKKGQGPGEAVSDFIYFLHGDDVFVHDWVSQRLWRLDFGGVLQEQIRLASKVYGGLVAVLPDSFLFLKEEWPPLSERTGRLLENLQTVAVIARDGAWQRDVVTFKPRNFLSPQGGMGWDSSITVASPDARLLYGYHSRDYLIETVDLTTGAVVRKFSRAYSKVLHSESAGELDFRKKSGAPKREFEPDIKNLFPVGDGLWVETSTDDKTKGRLIDVFDKNGCFIDSFYLGAGRTLMAVGEGSIICQEKNEDETITILKYKIDP